MCRYIDIIQIVDIITFCTGLVTLLGGREGGRLGGREEVTGVGVAAGLPQGEAVGVWLLLPLLPARVNTLYILFLYVCYIRLVSDV